MHAFAHQHAADAADVFETLLEEHEVHLLGLGVGVELLEAVESLAF
jgi:hypothetical protein